MIIKPSRRLLFSVGALLLLAIALGTASALSIEMPTLFQQALLGIALAYLLLCVFDAWRLYQQPPPCVQRLLSAYLSLGRSTTVTLNFKHAYRSPVVLEYFDHVPDSFEHSQLPYQVRLEPGHLSSTGYSLKPLQRGHFIVPGCSIALPSPMGLWTARHYVEHASEVRVYPDFSQLHSGQLHATESWLNLVGIQQQQRRGSGLEFHQLREFRSDDSIKHIDWKATARKRTPITREYQDERDQQIIFLLDCGRAMRSHDGPLNHLDHALNACLMLAYTALRLGDAVGAHTFAGSQRSIAPRKGQQQMSALLNGLYDIQASQDSADYSVAIQHLLQQQKRRALVIVISNLADEIDSDLTVAMRQLKKHHRTLFVSLREEVLDDLAEQPVQNYQQALLYCGSINYLRTRHSQQRMLSKQGVQVLDVRPSQLSSQLLNQYLKMKRSGHH